MGGREGAEPEEGERDWNTGALREVANLFHCAGNDDPVARQNHGPFSILDQLKRLLEQDKVSSVDSGLTTAAAAAGQTYLTQAADATTVATNIAGRSDVQQALKHDRPVDLQRLRADLPSPLSVTFYKEKKKVGGQIPQPPFLAASVKIDKCPGCRVVVSRPFDQDLITDLQKSGVVNPIQQLGLVSEGQLVSSGNLAGPVLGLRVGEPQTIQVNGVSVRAQAMGVPCGDPPATNCQVVAMYPSSALNDAIDSQRLRIIVPLILLALIIGVLAFAAADWMSRALNDLAERAMVLARGGARGDELDQLGAAIDQISSELSSRVGELEAERGRFKETLPRYGETLAATHDLNALVGKRFRVGDVECVGVELCHPCTTLEGLTKPGVIKGLVNRGGLNADIVTDGVIAVGDEVVAVD